MINVGQKVSITFGPDKSYTGVIAVVNPFVSQTQRTTKVRIDLPNPDLQVSGLGCTLTLIFRLISERD